MPPQADSVEDGFVAVARVLTVHGVRGELKVQPLGPPALIARGRHVRACDADYTIERTRVSARFAYVKLSGIDTRERARDLSGAYLQLPENDLEPLGEDEYYHFQLLGLAVRATDGRDLGEITDVVSTPANDVYVVTGPLGQILLPATEEVIREVNLQARTVTIEPLPGLLP